RKEEARRRPQQEPTDYFDADGRPQHHAIAMYCQRHYQNLNPKTQEFVDDMTAQTMWRSLSPKQEKWLITIFHHLGSGTRQCRRHRRTHTSPISAIYRKRFGISSKSDAG